MKEYPTIPGPAKMPTFRTVSLIPSSLALTK